MPSVQSQNRAHLCSFTFADGRRCRTPRSSSHLYLCTFHARKETQLHAADKLAGDVSYFFSADYLSANDLNAALGRLFAAVLQGSIKPKTASILAYLAQTMVQTLQLAQHEYIEACGADEWHNSIINSINQNYSRSHPTPAHNPQRETATPAANPDPSPTPPSQTPTQTTPKPAHLASEPGLPPTPTTQPPSPPNQPTASQLNPMSPIPTIPTNPTDKASENVLQFPTPNPTPGHAGGNASDPSKPNPAS